MEPPHHIRPPLLELPAERVLSPQAASAAAARATVRAALRDHGPEVVDTVELLACELVTNVIVHAATPIRLRLSQPRADVLRVEVHDDGDAGSDLTPTTPTATGDGGRGLFLVDALAAAWGTTPEASGKTVWFDVHVQARQPLHQNS